MMVVPNACRRFADRGRRTNPTGSCAGHGKKPHRGNERTKTVGWALAWLLFAIVVKKKSRVFKARKEEVFGGNALRFVRGSDGPAKALPGHFSFHFPCHPLIG